MTAAGCALFAASAMGAATDVVRETFETHDANTAVENVTTQGGAWSGYGTIKDGAYTYANTVGRPISGTTPSPRVLAVEGRVTHTLTSATTASKPASVDMMVQIALPDDTLAFPSGTETADIQIAVGVDQIANDDAKGILKVYCKNKAGTAGWYALGETQYAKDSWHRVSFTFDYANSLCQVRVDGEPMMTAAGYLTTDTANLPEQNGSWYKLAKSAATKLTSVQVVGSTSIDELLVKQDADATTVDSVLPVLADAGGTTAGVPNTWIEKQGITRAAAAGDAPDASGMTVAQKYRTGLSVADGKVFAITDMTMSGTKARLTVPVATANVGHNTIQYSTDNSTWTDAVADASGTVEVDINPGNAGTAPAVIYVRLVNKAAN